MTPLSLQTPLLVYGARLAGRQLRQLLIAQGHSVVAFLDRDARLREVDGVPVWRAEDWAAAHDPAEACVLVGIFNSYVDTCEVHDLLERLGFGRVMSLVQWVREQPDNQPFRYWLVDPRFYERNAERISWLRDRLDDAASRELLERIVEYRTYGDPRRLPDPAPRQYFPADLPAWPAPLRFIDCGAYTGDTVQALQAAGYAFEALATFEPNLLNYRRLVDALQDVSGMHFPCGVSDTNRLSGFDPALGEGGHLVEQGGDPVFCVRLDDALPGFAPNLVKMDIEGEEPAALAGAERLLRRYRPHLAISIYHRAEHLWSIAEQIETLNLGYRYYLRCHAQSSFDTVLYAIAQA